MLPLIIMQDTITFIPAELEPELQLRHERVQSLMGKQETLLVCGTSNLFYLTGRVFRGYVYLPRTGKPLYFVVRPGDYTPREDLIFIRKPEQIPAILGERGIPQPDHAGLEEDALSFTDTLRLRKVFEGALCFNASPLLTRARMIKTPYEIELMKRDGIHHAAVYRRISRLYKPDMTDLEFQIEIERVLRLEGCLGYARVSGPRMEINMGSVINGDNADAPSPYDFSMGGAGTDPSLPVGADGSIMHTGTAVMVDMNGSFNGYQTDMTRCWSIGRLPDLALKAHECSRAILRELERLATPGTEISLLYHRAEEMARETGLYDYFMGHRQKAGFIGHGVGIDLNEQPAMTARCHETLCENMTLALEPKFVIPHVGAVGVENTYVVRPDGLENITVFPEEITSLI